MGENQSKTPNGTNIEFFKRNIEGHSKVKVLNQKSKQLYEIYRVHGDKIVVFLTNIYTVGIADYIDILNQRCSI